MEFQNDGVVPDPQQIKKSNTLGFFGFSVDLCLGLCHRFVIRLLANVNLVHGFSASC